MGLQIVRRVVCDHCLKAGPSAGTEAAAVEQARAGGWLAGQAWGHAVFLCRDCVAGGLPDWWPDPSGTRFHWEES